MAWHVAHDGYYREFPTTMFDTLSNAMPFLEKVVTKDNFRSVLVSYHTFFTENVSKIIETKYVFNDTADFIINKDIYDTADFIINKDTNDYFNTKGVHKKLFGDDTTTTKSDDTTTTKSDDTTIPESIEKKIKYILCKDNEAHEYDDDESLKAILIRIKNMKYIQIIKNMEIYKYDYDSNIFKCGDCGDNKLASEFTAHLFCEYKILVAYAKDKDKPFELTTKIITQDTIRVSEDEQDEMDKYRISTVGRGFKYSEVVSLGLLAKIYVVKNNNIIGEIKQNSGKYYKGVHFGSHLNSSDYFKCTKHLKEYDDIVAEHRYKPAIELYAILFRMDDSFKSVLTENQFNDSNFLVDMINLMTEMRIRKNIYL